VVYVLDDDLSVRHSLSLLIESAGWHPEVFGSASDFLAAARKPIPACLLLDGVLPDIHGCDVQALLSGQAELPIIFMTGQGDLPMTIRAMKAGAADFFTKPFDSSLLLAAIGSALDRSRMALSSAENSRALRSDYASLSPRQREVMALIVHGRLNKQVGGTLGISEITVKAHRGKVMQKMHADSLPDLVRMADRLDIIP
jgi:FixJ family two-component response regulator